MDFFVVVIESMIVSVGAGLVDTRVPRVVGFVPADVYSFLGVFCVDSILAAGWTDDSVCLK